VVQGCVGLSLPFFLHFSPFLHFFPLFFACFPDLLASWIFSLSCIRLFFVLFVVFCFVSSVAEGSCGREWQDTALVLFLNKKDLFKDKIEKVDLVGKPPWFLL
jgi:hypothetical protein